MAQVNFDPRTGRASLHPLPGMPLEVKVVGGQPVVSMQKTEDGNDIYKFENTDFPRRLTAAEMTKHLLSGPEGFDLRSRFLEVRSAAEAYEFLTSCYAFHVPTTVKSSQITLEQFKAWQSLVREVTIRDFPFRNPSGGTSLYWQKPVFCEWVGTLIQKMNDEAPQGIQDWLRGEVRGVSFHRSEPLAGEQPRASMRVDVGTAIEAMLASIYFARFVGIESKLCELEGCDRIFDLTSKHEKKCCCTEHAHLNATRRRRRAAKKGKNGKA